MKARQLESVPQRFNAPLTRRIFLLGALVAGGGWATGRLAWPGRWRPRAIADLHLADFEALRGERFRLYGRDGLPTPVHLDVVKNATLASSQASTARPECFSLAFCAAKGLAMAQGTYTFAHPTLGFFELFIVPAQPVTHEERYIAIINRL